MRGFLLLEMLLACAVLGMTITGLLYTIFNLTPSIVAAEQAEDAIAAASSLASSTYGISSLPQAISTTTSTTSSFSRALYEMEDPLFSVVRSVVAWKNVYGIQKTTKLEVRMPRSLASGSVCDPFVTGDWNNPNILGTYALHSSGLLESGAQGDLVSISDITATPTRLIVSAESTANVQSPSLFLFSVSGTSTPVLIGSTDNASTSRIGYAKIAADKSLVYAGNGFGSASAQTCADASCAQLHIISIASSSAPHMLSSLALSTTSAPFAVRSGGSTAPASAIAYRNGYVFLGLSKTISGQEFNIIDVQDPEHPVWRSGFHIGRTVTSITVRDATAYLTTDDPAQELLILNVSDPNSPIRLGSWDAPGSTAFGYGSSATAHAPYVRFGRTYSSNAAEFELLDITDPSHVRESISSDRGTTKDPQSVRGMLTQDFITFLLLTNRLEIWNTGKPEDLREEGKAIPFPPDTKAAALTCRNNLLYLAVNRADGAGFISIVRGG